RYRLVRLVRIAARIGNAVDEYVGEGTHRLVVKHAIEQAAAPSDRWLDHKRAPTRPQYSRRFAKEDEREFEMVQHVDHDDIGGAGVGKGNAPGIPPAKQPPGARVIRWQ